VYGTEITRVRDFVSFIYHKKRRKCMEDKISVLISETEVNARISEMAEQLSSEYAGKTVHIIGVLKGSVFFMCELAQKMSIPVTMDFMSVSSYGDARESSGVVKLIKDLDESIAGRDVVLVEDIMDSGRTLSYLMAILKERKPNSIKLITLLDKPERRVVDIQPDMTGFVIPDRFVVGYGLDCAQKYRNLPYIGVIE
jgi:hypoxanthine phosphoribosyltransferase